jgi:hypothetical protein
MMSLMRESMGLTANQNQKSSIGEIVSAVRELRSVASEITPEKESASDGDSMSNMLPKLLEIIQVGMAQKQAQVELQTTMPTVSLPVTMQANESDDAMNPFGIFKLKGYLKSLIAMAALKQDPAQGAELIYEKLPDDMIEMLELPNWFEALQAFESGVTEHAEWFLKARDAALLLFNAPEDETHQVEARPV